MRWLVILVVSVLTAAACGGDGVTAPSPPIPVSTSQPPPPPLPELTVTIPSVAVSRDKGSNGYEWWYRPEVLITETSGRAGADVVAWGAGPADGPPIAYNSVQDWCGDSRGAIDPAVENLVLRVPPGGTLNLSQALRPLYCSPAIGSTDPESSVLVAVRFLDDHRRTIEAAGSGAVP